MKQLNRKELLAHFYEIEKKIDKIYFILMENKKISSLKLELYVSQLELLNLETKKTLDNLFKLSKKSLLISMLIAVLDFILSLIAIISLFSNMAFGIGLLMFCLGLSLIALNNLKKENAEISQDDLTQLCNTISNCQMLLTRQLDRHYSEVKQARQDSSKEHLETKANAIILYYLDNLNLEVNDNMLESKVRDVMIIMLQNELKTEEKSLTKLIAMARQINQKNPFALEEDQDVMVLSRKNKKR